MFVRWLYRGSDLGESAHKLQREPFAQELFLTEVVEENDLATILGRCYVLPVEKYARLPSAMYDSNVFCCALLFNSARDSFAPIESFVKSGPFFTEPPSRAPRINMPAVPLSGVPFPGFLRGPKKKKRVNGNAASVLAATVCCIDKCENVCFSKMHSVAKLRCDWVYKVRGKYVCEEHLCKDRRMCHLKRSRSVSPPPLMLMDEDGEEEEENGPLSLKKLKRDRVKR